MTYQPRPPGSFGSSSSAGPHAAWQASRPVGSPVAPQVGWTVGSYPITVAGLVIPGDLLYIGQNLPASRGDVVEPALIDPWLPVDWRMPDWQGQAMDYWPSYSTISPQSRAAYLHWLSTGRRHPDVYIGYVFLFFYGLERRVLHELPQMAQAQQVELPLIRAEVDRLIQLFGGNRSFYGYARGLREVLDVIGLLGTDVCAGDAPAADRESVPMRLRLGLSQFATTSRPLPADWARAWLMSRPDFYPRTAATRCAAEFAELFRSRYAARHGDGLILRPNGRDLTVDYHPASAGFRGSADLRLGGRPDVFDQAAPLRKLTGLAEECIDALDAYSRFLGRDPNGRGSITGAALLPPELQDLESGQVGELIDWARSRLGRMPAVTVSAQEFMTHLPPDTRPAKKDIITLAQLLAQAGVGMEPDPRLGGPIPASGRMVLFRAEGELSATPSEAYQSATLLLHLGAAVSAADGHVAAEERELLVGHLKDALYLSSGERTRLRAHLRWLLTTELKLTGLTRRVAALDKRHRERIADFLASVAAADGVIDPAEVTMLKRIRKLLDLDPEQVHSSLHAAATTPPAAAGPVTVRAGQPSPGHTIPRPAEPEPKTERVEGRVQLDEFVLAARLAEAAEVAALLGSVFEEEQPRPVAPSPPAVEPVAGLDGAHSALLRSMAGKETISRAEWEQLAADVHLMPDGALDRLNEAGYETVGEPVSEGDDPIEINQYAMGELL
ncbi:MAG: hypothetical protein JWL97_3868 [Gemmatimonadales bacterium]|nr:hypothetical protein [Gemmatimonadales bacterium]